MFSTPTQPTTSVIQPNSVTTSPTIQHIREDLERTAEGIDSTKKNMQTDFKHLRNMLEGMMEVLVPEDEASAAVPKPFTPTRPSATPTPNLSASRPPQLPTPPTAAATPSQPNAALRQPQRVSVPAYAFDAGTDLYMPSAPSISWTASPVTGVPHPAMFNGIVSPEYSIPAVTSPAARMQPSNAEMLEMVRMAMRGIDDAQAESALLNRALKAAQEREVSLQESLVLSHREAQEARQDAQEALEREQSTSEKSPSKVRDALLQAAGGDVSSYVGSLETALHGCEGEIHLLEAKVAELEQIIVASGARSGEKCREAKKQEAWLRVVLRAEGAQMVDVALQAAEDVWAAQRAALTATVQLKEDELNVCTTEIIHLRDDLEEARQAISHERHEAMTVRQDLKRTEELSKTELMHLMSRVEELESSANHPAKNKLPEGMPAAEPVEMTIQSSEQSGVFGRDRANTRNSGPGRETSKEKKTVPVRRRGDSKMGQLKGGKLKAPISCALGTACVLWLRAAQAASDRSTYQDLTQHFGTDKLLANMIARLKTTYEAERVALKATMREYVEANRTLQRQNDELSETLDSLRRGHDVNSKTPRGTSVSRPMDPDDLRVSNLPAAELMDHDVDPIWHPPGSSHHPIREGIDPDETLTYF